MKKLIVVMGVNQEELDRATKNQIKYHDFISYYFPSLYKIFKQLDSNFKQNTVSNNTFVRTIQLLYPTIIDIITIWIMDFDPSISSPPLINNAIITFRQEFLKMAKIVHMNNSEEFLKIFEKEMQKATMRLIFWGKIKKQLESLTFGKLGPHMYNITKFMKFSYKIYLNIYKMENWDVQLIVLLDYIQNFKDFSEQFDRLKTEYEKLVFWFASQLYLENIENKILDENVDNLKLRIVTKPFTNVQIVILDLKNIFEQNIIIPGGIFIQNSSKPSMKVLLGYFSSVDSMLMSNLADITELRAIYDKSISLYMKKWEENFSDKYYPNQITNIVKTQYWLLYEFFKKGKEEKGQVKLPSRSNNRKNFL